MAAKSEQPYERVLAEYYDHVPLYANRADVEFYVSVARDANGKILELGCGTGRILIPTAAAGCAIVGLDLSEAMLEKCRAKLAQQPPDVQKRVRLVPGNMAAFDLGEKFRLVTIPFRGFQHLLRVEDQLACLTGVHCHLEPGGRLVFDMFHVLPQGMHDPEWMKEREDTPETQLPDGRRFRRTHRITAFHRAGQYNEVEFAVYVTHPDGRAERLTDRFAFRYFFRYEVEHLLARTSFAAVNVFGNFDRSDFADDSPEMIFVAEKTSGSKAG
jgi:SAM-dependent methyltransferase